MATTNALALSGMQAAQTRLDVAAGNIANSETPGYRRRVVQQTAQADGGVSTGVATTQQAGPAMESDVVSQLQAKHAFIANLAVFKTQNAMTGALMNEKA